MPNPQTKVFVVPGAGRKMPLPVPGDKISVPAEGRLVIKSLAVMRLLRCGDLVEQSAPAPVPTQTPASAAPIKPAAPPQPTPLAPLAQPTSKEG